MITLRRRLILVSVAAVLSLLVMSVLPGQLSAAGAGGLLHPARRPVTDVPPLACEDATFAGEGITLKGWRCDGSAPHRGTVLYLHGIADNRSSAAGVVDRFVTRGYDVIAYDSRAHGESEGDLCTYGFLEKRDLSRVLDGVREGPILLVGTSLGAAVALQEAATDPRISAIIAAETFADLRTVATERAPFFFTAGIIDRAFRMAEKQGSFEVDAVSPVTAAAHITIPVLLVHGADDSETVPDHSRRVLAALRGRKQLILVPGARHNQSLTAEVWREIDVWLQGVLREPPPEPAGIVGNRRRMAQSLYGKVRLQPAS